MDRSKTTRRRTRLTIAKITKAQIEAIEREYCERYNSGIPQWQAEYYK
jgi:hypothetical protein